MKLDRPGRVKPDCLWGRQSNSPSAKPFLAKAVTMTPTMFRNGRTQWPCILFAVMVLQNLICQIVLAQNIVYPSSYPVQSYPSYPVQSYPVEAYSVESYPVQSHLVESYPIVSYPTGSQPVQSQTIVHPTTVPTSSTSSTVIGSSEGQSRSTRRTSQMPTMPTMGRSDLDRYVHVDDDTSLASRRLYDSRSRLAGENPFQNRSQQRGQTYQENHPQHLSPYRIEEIEAADAKAEKLRRFAENTVPILADIAIENARYIRQWAELATSYRELTFRVDDANAQLFATSQDLDDTRAKLENYGLTPTIGVLLQQKREQLDRWQVIDSEILFADEELTRTRQQQLALELIRYDGSDAEAQTSLLLADAGLDSANRQDQSLVSQVHDLLVNRGQWLQALNQGYQDYREKLGELDSATVASNQLTMDYRTLIDRHVMWIPSDEPAGVGDLEKLKGGFGVLFDFGRSSGFGPTIQRKIQSDFFAAATTFVGVMLIFMLRWRAKAWLVAIGSRKRMREFADKWRKVCASVLTVLVAFAFPAVLFVVARWLGTGIVSEATLDASAGFYAASLVGLAVEIARQLLRKFGYLDKHVKIDLPRRAAALRYLTIIGFGLIVAAYTVKVMGAVDHGMWRGSLARLGFVLSMLLVAWTAHIGLKPKGGFLEPLIAKYGGKVIHRLRLMIYLAGIGFPFLMILLSMMGYGFTANEIIERLLVTVASALIAATLWPAIKIVSADAWQRLTGATPPPKQFDEYGEIPANESGVSGTLGEHFLELKHHLAFLCQCVLVVAAFVCIGWLWVDVFPNVRMGNPVLWTVQTEVTSPVFDSVSQSLAGQNRRADLLAGQSLAAQSLAGQSLVGTRMETKNVTVLHVLMAVVSLFVAFQLAKLLPALFDALVLQRVSFDEAMEHLSLVIGRCLLFGIGCFLACRFLGVRWQTIQWLAVGLTIGVGFGLQDMVRNIFGGLVVLFEKPAKLGDLITVGKVTGRVSFQRLRTTVVSDDEGREVMIPNKNFVSDHVINWMGAGRLNVIPIEVAVKRDQRAADVCRTLQELVIEQPDVLLTPAPQATLVCVGQRSQRIEVRAWIEEGQNAERYRDGLLSTVRRYLREENLLSSDQPSQPPIQGHGNDVLGGGGTGRSRSGRNRARSA